MENLEKRIGHQFQDKDLLKQAMTHSSFTNEQKINHRKNYERIEFLGDAVLELISSEYLFFENPDMPEGKLTKARASIVCEQALAVAARELELGKFMLFGKGEELTGGRERDSIIADAVEAVIGAIYLDAGIEKAKAFVKQFVLNDLENKKLFYDAKTVLQEYIQGNRRGNVSYELLGEEGPDHDKVFVSRVMFEQEELGIGRGKTKKAAEQNAAYEAILKLRK